MKHVVSMLFDLETDASEAVSAETDSAMDSLRAKVARLVALASASVSQVRVQHSGGALGAQGAATHAS